MALTIRHFVRHVNRLPDVEGCVLNALQKRPRCRMCLVSPLRIGRSGGACMKPEIEIYDTTLRDGSQGEGINFSVMDKLRIAEKLDSFGVHYIEGGWPGSNPKDIEFFAQAKKRKFKNANRARSGRPAKKNTPVEQDDQVRLLIEAGTPVVTI